MIRAEAHSDDYAVEVAFDAEPWFAAASDEEIRDLATEGPGWGASYAADEVARELASSNRDLEMLFWYLDHLSGTQRACGFEVYINEQDALLWLRENRPHLYAEFTEDKEE